MWTPRLIPIRTKNPARRCYFASGSIAKPSWTEPDKRLHGAVSLLTIDLRKITTIRVVGNHLLLVDSDRNVRSYTRLPLEDLRRSHALILAAEISAARHWKCVVETISGTSGSEDTRVLLADAAETALELLKLSEEQLKARHALVEARANNTETSALQQALDSVKARRAALIQSSAFLKINELFVAENPPAFCAQN